MWGFYFKDTISERNSHVTLDSVAKSLLRMRI